MSRRSVLLLGILAMGIGLAALREFVFVNLNYQIHYLERGLPYSYAHSRFQAWATGWDLAGLVRMKWLLALAFIAINLSLAIAFSRVLHGDHRYRKAIVAGFVVVGILALVGHALAGSIAGLGMLSIKLLHALQYPVLLLVLWAASWLPRR